MHDAGTERYPLTKEAGLFFHAKNLTNAPLRFYEGSSDRPIQRECYDQTLEADFEFSSLKWKESS